MLNGFRGSNMMAVPLYCLCVFHVTLFGLRGREHIHSIIRMQHKCLGSTLCSHVQRCATTVFEGRRRLQRGCARVTRGLGLLFVRPDS